MESMGAQPLLASKSDGFHERLSMQAEVAFRVLSFVYVYHGSGVTTQR
jgi:hypothetical protein